MRSERNGTDRFVDWFEFGFRFGIRYSVLGWPASKLCVKLNTDLNNFDKHKMQNLLHKYRISQPPYRHTADPLRLPRLSIEHSQLHKHGKEIVMIKM